MNKVFIPIKIVVTAVVLAGQFLLIRYARDLIWYLYFGSCAGGTAFLLLAALLKRSGRRNAHGMLKWTGYSLLFLPAAYAAISAFTLYYMFGYKVLIVVVPLAALCVFATCGGSVSAIALGAIPLFFLLSYYRNVPREAVYVSAAAAVIVAFFVRKLKAKVGLLFRLFFISLYFFFLYGMFWYLSPMTRLSAKVVDDDVVRHIAPIEKRISESPYPRGFYAVGESCDGKSLFVSNLFHTPGVLEWRRGDAEAVVHNEIDGSAEQIAFDCAKDDVLIGEYNTGRILMCEGGWPEGKCRRLPARVPKPCRISHYPGSNLYYVNSDYATFPWYVVDGSGKVLQRIVMGQAEEIVPLEDDTFLTVTEGIVYRMRIGKNGGLRTLSAAVLPGLGMSFGPLYQHLAFDEKRRYLFVSDFDTGFIFRVNLKTMGVKRFGRYGRGMRHIACSPEYGLLAAGNYLNGDLMLISESGGTIIYRKKIGTRLRGVTVSRDGERVYAVSRAGVFEARLKMVHGAEK